MFATLVSLTLAGAVASTPPGVPPVNQDPWGYVGSSEIHRIAEENVTARVISRGPGAWASLLQARPGIDTPIHTHDTIEMIYGLSGIALVVVGNQNIVMGPGQTVVVPAGVPHGLYVPVSAGFDFLAMQVFATAQPELVYQPGAAIPAALLPTAPVTADPTQLTEPLPVAPQRPVVGQDVAPEQPVVEPEVAPEEPVVEPEVAPTQPAAPAQPVAPAEPAVEPLDEEPIDDRQDPIDDSLDPIDDDLEEPIEPTEPIDDSVEPVPDEPVPVETEPRPQRMVPARAQPVPEPFPQP